MKRTLPSKKNYGSKIFKSISVLFFIMTSIQLSFAQPGQSLNFDGTNDYALTATDIIGTGTSYTKEAWIRVPTVDLGNSAYNFLSQNNGASALYIFQGHVVSGQNSAYPPQVTDPSALVANTWYHVAVTYNEATHTMVLYINGSAVSTATSVNSITSGAQLAIGATYAGYYGYTFNGDMDEVRIWDYARTSGEISANYQCTVPPNSPGLTAYYDFNQGTAGGDNTAISKLIDRTANGNDATLNNFTLNFSSSNFISDAPTLTGECSVVPVRMVSFTGKSANGQVELNWTTATEINNAGFDIERSANGSTGWSNIGYVAGKGNSVGLQHYSFTDANPLDGVNFYRLRQSDMDGHATYSNVVSVKSGNLNAVALYPTIAKSSVQLVSNDAVQFNTPFVIVNNIGKTVQSGTIQSNRQSIDISNLNSGVYFLKIQNQKTLKFIKE